MYDESKKKAIMKWRGDNKEKYNQYMNEYCKNKYRPKLNQYRMKYYYMQKELKLFLNILLEK